MVATCVGGRRSINRNGRKRLRLWNGPGSGASDAPRRLGSDLKHFSLSTCEIARFSGNRKRERIDGPDPGRSVAGGSHNALGIGTERRLEDRASVTGEGKILAAVFCVPDAGRGIVRRGDNPLAIGTESGRVYAVVVPPQDKQLFPRWRRSTRGPYDRRSPLSRGFRWG